MANKKHLDDLCGLFVGIRARTEALGLLKDILTPRELRAVTQRLQIIKMLAKGTPQREISHKLKVSISKVTRGSRALKSDHGGFGKFIKNM